MVVCRRPLLVQTGWGGAHFRGRGRCHPALPSPTSRFGQIRVKPRSGDIRPSPTAGECGGQRSRLRPDSAAQWLSEHKRPPTARTAQTTARLWVSLSVSDSMRRPRAFYAAVNTRHSTHDAHSSNLSLPRNGPECRANCATKTTQQDGCARCGCRAGGSAGDVRRRAHHFRMRRS
jgi:hypothetical protein